MYVLDRPTPNHMPFLPRASEEYAVIPGYVWVLTIVAIAALLAFDFCFHVRKAHEPTLREATKWSIIYVGIALIFGVGVGIVGNHGMGQEYFAGYVTEKALSVDNLFVFLIIMSSFRVPRADQQKVLLFGIVFALIARSGFIAMGAFVLDRLSFAFYIFGAFLIFTAIKLIHGELSGEESDEANNTFVRLAKRLIRTTDHYDGDKLFTIENGKRVLTPMLLVMVAIGGTDILFALDSIPAIFGLTQNTYIVFTATAFSLMGLRQLYFLLDGLLDRLVYLSYGLSAILLFIGVKMVLHALHENDLPFINDGESVPVPEVTTTLSLGVIVGILAVTVVVSLTSPRGQALTLYNQFRRNASAFMNTDFGHDTFDREARYREIRGLAAKLEGVHPKHLSEDDFEEIRATVERVDVHRSESR